MIMQMRSVQLIITFIAEVFNWYIINDAREVTSRIRNLISSQIYDRQVGFLLAIEILHQHTTLLDKIPLQNYINLNYFNKIK